MAKLPQQLTGWLRLLQKGWPDKATQPDLAQGLLALARFYIQADSDARRTIRSHVANTVSDRLAPFVHRVAEESVQHGIQDRLTEGLAALALGSEKLDPRDVITGFSLLAHSAEKLGIQYERLFESALGFAGEDFGEQITEFLARDAEDRSIYEMGYREYEDNTGFKYVRHGDF